MTKKAILVVCWQRDGNHDSGALKFVPPHHLSCLKHWNRNRQNIETDSEKCLMISTRMSAKQLYFTRISCDNGGLSSAGIHCLWRGLLQGSGNNWPDRVPTPIAQHLCYQNCYVRSGWVRHNRGSFCQMFLLSWFWFDVSLVVFLNLYCLYLYILTSCCSCSFFLTPWEHALSAFQFMPTWPLVPARCLKACCRAELRTIWRNLATTSVHSEPSTDLTLEGVDSSWCVLDYSNVADEIANIELTWCNSESTMLFL